MILTCPACGTQYLVKEGAIPPAGRQVRCASCGHSWHQEPEEGGERAEAPVAQPAEEQAAEPAAETEAPGVGDEAGLQPEGEAALGDMVSEEQSAPAEDVPFEPEVPEPPPAQVDIAGTAEDDSGAGWAVDDEFAPFGSRAAEEPRRRGGILLFALLLALIAAAAAAFWMLAPAEWHQRLGIARADEQTPLQLMMTHSDRQQLASGNELLAVSGRVINPTDEPQPVPPIRAELRSSSGELVYRWTIPPPARTLAPGASASFNSAELNVPAGGDELTVTIGEPKA